METGGVYSEMAVTQYRSYPHGPYPCNAHLGFAMVKPTWVSRGQGPFGIWATTIYHLSHCSCNGVGFTGRGDLCKIGQIRVASFFNCAHPVS
jgi:hypothetical protein